ncbi:MAG: hypothetical protein Q7T81_14725 [Pseudolabrys sp.]|nr:hypothetical protein [Pseudolabrys sp.]
MKSTIYLRIAKNDGRKGYKVAASTEPNSAPITSKDYRGEIFYPTVAFGVEINIPDELFEQASRVVAQLDVAMKGARVTGEIVIPEGITVKQKKA